MIHKRIIASNQFQELYDVSETLKQQCKALVLKLNQQIASLNLQKQYLNCFKQYLKQVKPQNIKQTVENELKKITQNISIFNQIHIKKNKRKNVLRKIQEFGIHRTQIQNQLELDTFLQLFSKLRKYTLSYVETILKMCCIYSNKNCDRKQVLIKSMKKIFKKLDDQQTIMKKSNFGKLLNLGEGFDPFFLNYLGGHHISQIYLKESDIGQRAIIQKKIDSLFHFDIAYSSRLIHAHNQIVICFTQKKDSCCGLDLGLNQPKSNVRYVTEEQQIHTPQSQRNKKLAIFNNYRRKVSKSLDKDIIKKRMSFQSSSQLSPNLRAKSNEPKSFQSQKSMKINSQLQLNRGKKLNFKTVILDPLQDKSDSSDSNLINNINFRGKSKTKNSQQKSIHSIKSQKMQYSKSEIKKKYINMNNYDKQETNQNKNYDFQSQKYSDSLKFKQQRLSQTQQQNSPRNSMLYLKGKKQVFSCDQIAQTKIAVQNRTRRITEVEGQNQDSPRRRNTPHQQELKKQIQKTLINLQEANNKNNIKNAQIVVEAKKQTQNQPSPSSFTKQYSPYINSNQDPKEKQKNSFSPIEQKKYKMKQFDNPKKQQNEINKEQNIVKNKELNENIKLKVQQSGANKIIRKVQIRPTKINVQNVQQYFKSKSVHHMYDYLIEQSNRNHFYISQFYLGEELAIIVVLSYFSQRNAYHIRLWHVLPSFIEVDQSRSKFVELAFKKYLQYLQSHTSCDQIIFEGKLSDILQQNQFQQFQQNLYLRKRKLQKKGETCNQFLSVLGSMLNFKQNIKQSLLYSDEIEQFKEGKYYCNPKLFQFKKKANEDMINNCKICFIQIGDLTFQNVNQQLQKQSFDTYSFGDECIKLAEQIYKSQNQKVNTNLNLVKMCQRIKQSFITSKGYIRMIGNLVFHNNNLLICSVNLTNRHKMYFGKGFQHIISMTNKIVHYKSMKTQQKQIKFWAKMFTKQLYGKIKFEDNQAIYGNWEINFVWKQQIQGKVNHSLDNDVIFGQSPFFVCVQCGDEIVLGTQIHENDFLF